MITLPKQIEIAKAIQLEKIALHHCASLFAQIDRHRDYLSHFVHWTRFTHTIADSQAFVQLCEQEAKQGISYVWAICVAGKAMGTISFNKPIDWQHRTAFLGYWLSPEAQGKGIITQAINQLIQATQADFDCYVLRCATHNQRSNAVAKRCGFTFLETKENAERIGETMYAQHIYEKKVR